MEPRSETAGALSRPGRSLCQFCETSKGVFPRRRIEYHIQAHTFGDGFTQNMQREEVQMRKVLALAALVAIVGLAPVALAQEDLVGKVGGDFSAGDMLFDGDVTARNLEDARGEVILIKYWGLKCGPCLASMPKVQQLWDEYKGKGLHIFHVESQGHTEEQVVAHCESKGYTFPQTMRGSGTDFSAYPGGNGLPYGFLLGVDGKVIWQGRHGYEAVIHEEMKKVRYPGLAKTEVADGLKKAAKSFALGKYASAIREATKNLENAELAEGAQYIIDRANGVGERMREAVESAKESREFVRALQTLQRISKAFKGMPIGDEASEEFSTLKKEPTVKKELKAERALLQIMVQVNKAPTKEKQAALLRAFAKKFDGTKAAERAARRAGTI